MGQARMSLASDQEGAVAAQAATAYRSRGIPTDWYVDPADPESAAFHQRENHQRRLHGVGPAHRQEAANQRVQHSGGRAVPEGLRIRQSEYAFKQSCAGNNAGMTAHVSTPCVW